MGYILNFTEADKLFCNIFDKYDVYAPKRFPKQGRYSDTDIVRYDKVEHINEIEFKQKSDYAAKEILTPINETLFYFIENEYRESTTPQKPILLFARPCDINAFEIQSKIYEENGDFCDIYYARLKNNLKFVLMDCNGGEDTCFCVSMNSNTTDNWAIAIKQLEDKYLLAIKDTEFIQDFQNCEQADFTPEFVKSNELSAEVKDIPNKEVLNKLKEHPFWQEYDKRCISCGSCTISCPTCTCFTTKDIIYSENPKVGERKRVQASCQIEGFDKMAGQKEIRNKASERMRYKVLHKFHDYKERFKLRHMCVGCGRCINRCPESISIVTTLNKMNKAIDEIMNNESSGVNNDSTK